jgi:adenylate cyclase
VVEEIGGCQINLGLVHADRGDHRAAEQSYCDAAVTFEQAGFEAGRAMAYGNRAFELLALGEHGQARTLGLQALALAERVGDHLTVGDVQQTLALTAEGVGDLAGARLHALAAVAAFARAGAPDESASSQELLARAHEPEETEAS